MRSGAVNHGALLLALAPPARWMPKDARSSRRSRNTLVSRLTPSPAKFCPEYPHPLSRQALP